MPWMSSRCRAGSISGTPPWLRSKCRPLGVIVPSSASRGVRAEPLPVVPGCERISVRITGFSERGDEYQVAVTEAVPEQRFDDDASLVLETRDLGPAEFRSVVESLRFVSLEEFERAAGR